MPEFLSDSPSVSERLIKGAFRLFSSKRNSSISSSNERQDEAISSSGNAAASRKFFVEVVVQLVEGFVELARQPGEDPFEPKILA